MSSDEPSLETVLAEVSASLGSVDVGALATDGPPGLHRFKYKQLLDSSRRLGLVGTSKLNKHELAERIWQALKSVGAFTSSPPPPAPTPPDDVLRTAEASGPPVDIERAEQRVTASKFDVGQAPAEAPRHIPWSYDQDRVTAMAVDPDRMFVYWEVTDSAIDRARSGLGPGGPGAWLLLRVYDTTGRIFDGTNAHSYFDHKVDRNDRHWFFTIGKPTSEAVVEIGLQSHEGYFVKIARSARVEFPRREPPPWGNPEWMTVRSGGAVEHAGTGAPHGGGAASAGGPGGPGGGGPGAFDPVALWEMRRGPWDEVRAHGAGGWEEKVEWSEHFRDDEGGHTHRVFNWEGPVTAESWESGPFTYPVEFPAPVQEGFEGKTQVFRVGGRTHIVHGPWQVVIRGLGAHQRRQVIARWHVYRTWIAEEGHEITLRGGGTAAPGASDLRLGGASERRWMGASELLMAGASELWFRGASERRLGGASERSFAGASEWVMRGSSERRFLGASELRFGGASEWAYQGASEARLGGASERRLGGASEQRPSGFEAADASFRGASEERLGTPVPYPVLPGDALPTR